MIGYGKLVHDTCWSFVTSLADDLVYWHSQNNTMLIHAVDLVYWHSQNKTNTMLIHAVERWKGGTLTGRALEQVKQYKCVGSFVGSSSRIDDEVDSRRTVLHVYVARVCCTCMLHQRS